MNGTTKESDRLVNDHLASFVTLRLYDSSFGLEFLFQIPRPLSFKLFFA